MSFEEVDGESTMLLPQYNKSGNSADEKLAKFVKWTVNINLLIVSTTRHFSLPTRTMLKIHFTSVLSDSPMTQNVVLLSLKLMVALVSNSISLFASVVDSAMDLLSTLILFGASKAIEDKTWKQRYPVGLRRAEPMGVVVFSVFMIAR